MKILITGANSPLGKAVCRIAPEYNVNTIGSFRTAHKNWDSIILKQKLILDLSDIATFRNIPKGIDAIVHIAAASEGDAETLMQVTGLGTWRLIQRAKQLGIHKIVHISSMSVYGSISGPIVGEQTPICHTTPYGVAKWAAECYLKESFAEIQSTSIRAPAIVGLNSRRHFWARLMKSMQQNVPEVTVQNPDFLFNNLIHTDTLAHFIIGLIKKDFRQYNAYPIASSNPIPLSQIVSRLSNAFGYQGRIQWEESSSTPFSIDYSRAVTLGYKPLCMDETLSMWIESEKTADL
jgi:nucleoside-diphosphate-sugar epimerase